MGSVRDNFKLKQLGLAHTLEGIHAVQVCGFVAFV